MSATKRERARKTISIRVKHTTHKELVRLAKQEKRAVGNYIRTVLEQLTDKKEAVSNG